MKMYRFAPLALAVSCSIILTACGGGGSDSGTTDATISGAIVAAPVDGAQVSVTDVSGNLVAGPVSTTAGQYSLIIPAGSLGLSLILKSTGGTFTDEATGNSGNAGEMSAYMAANSISGSSSVSATPGSTIVAELVLTHSKTLTQAKQVFADAFGYTPDITITPADATDTATATASDEAKLAGYRAASFSQLAMNLGLSQDSQFDMFTALAKDLSDDTLDGVDASGSISIGSTGHNLNANIQNDFSTALVNFHSSVYNQTDMANDEIGNVPFAKIALTTNYKTEYVPGSMAAMEGKSTFQLHITNRSDGTNVTGATIMLMPMMHMSTMTHSSPVPVAAVSEDGNGLYTATAYYLMASTMMDGTSMGFWDLGITANGESAHFYPSVMMAMGDTVKTRLKGQTDKIVDMMSMSVSRDYNIFKDKLMASSGAYNFTVFIAAKESMMSFPALIDGDTLTSGMGGTSLPVTSILVEFSIDDGANWTTAVDGTNGTWAATGLALTAGQENQIRVRLTVNGEVKTTDGLAADGSNDYASFTVTPGSM